MENYREIALIVLALSLVAALADAEDPQPSPTPRPKTLAAYAGSINLRRPVPSDADGGLTLSTQAVAEIAKRGTLTAGGVSSGKSPETRPAISNSEKAKWQALVRKQRSVIAKLELKKDRIEKEIDLIEGGQLTARALARVEKAKIEHDFLEKEIRRARLELGKIIRDARQHGAQPGWFR